MTRPRRFQLDLYYWYQDGVDIKTVGCHWFNFPEQIISSTLALLKKWVKPSEKSLFEQVFKLICRDWRFWCPNQWISERFHFKHAQLRHIRCALWTDVARLDIHELSWQSNCLCMKDMLFTCPESHEKKFRLMNQNKIDPQDKTVA